MKKTITLLGLSVFTCFIMAGCKADDKQEKGEAPDNLVGKTEGVSQVETSEENVVLKEEDKELKLKDFLYSPEGTYGWETPSDKIIFDFLKDGRLHIQGPDGEATMWEGTWMLKGNRLTLFRPDLKKAETDTVKIEGENLILGGKTYTRHQPS